MLGDICISPVALITVTCSQVALKEASRAGWKARSQMMRKKFGMTPDEKPWSTTHHLRGVPPCARNYDCIDVGVGWYRWCFGELPAGQRLKLFIDWTQAVERIPFSTKPLGAHQTSRDYCCYTDQCMDAKASSSFHIVVVIATVSIGCFCDSCVCVRMWADNLDFRIASPRTSRRTMNAL